MKQTRILIVKNEFIEARQFEAELELSGYSVCSLVHSGEMAV